MAEQHSNLSPRLEGHQREQPKYNLKVLKAEFCTVRDTADCNGRVADNNRQVPPRERVQIIISSNFQPSGQNNNPELAMLGARKTR